MTKTMCGRYTLKTPAGEIISEFNLHGGAPDIRPRYNIAPTQDVLVVLRDDEGRNVARSVRWGLVPFWAKDPSIGNRMINARAESVQAKPAFRNAFAKRRCLVVADGFYEWLKRPGGKQPYHIRRIDGRPFGFAGIWEEWGPRSEPLRSCAIITTTANPLLEPIHDRMPVILTGHSAAVWLDAASAADECAGMLRPCPADDLCAYPVSNPVNSPANDSSECVDPLEAGPADRHSSGFAR
jgi:putative SOS response-associated peptidase YedK